MGFYFVLDGTDQGHCCKFASFWTTLPCRLSILLNVREGPVVTDEADQRYHSKFASLWWNLSSRASLLLIVRNKTVVIIVSLDIIPID